MAVLRAGPTIQCRGGVDQLLAPSVIPHQPGKKKGPLPPPPPAPVNWGQEVYVPAFTLGASDLAAGKGFEAAVASGWRMFTPYVQDRAILAVMTLDTPDSPAEVCGLQQDDRANAAFDAFGQIQAAQEYASCELKWLSIPAVLFEGFWLVSHTAGEPDLVSPVFTCDPELQPQGSSVIKADDLLTTARSFAVNRLKYSDMPVQQASEAGA
jgi:hypothetical protein